MYSILCNLSVCVSIDLCNFISTITSACLYVVIATSGVVIYLFSCEHANSITLNIGIWLMEIMYVLFP